MNAALRSFLAEPRVADPPRRVWRDHVLAAGVVVSATIETIARPDLAWRPLALFVCIGLAAMLLYRRQHPLSMTAIGFGAVTVASIALAIVDHGPFGLNSTAFILVLPYALFRWGSGRDAAFGVPIMLAVWAIALVTDPGTIGDALGGLAALAVPALLGATVRYRSTARRRELDEVKLREREQLARELHDTVAHHVSAIAVQAQAGLAVAATRPEVAREVLEVIEEAASRTLDEMRAMVGALRNGDDAELAPQQGVADLHRLARDASGSLHIDVEVSPDVGDVAPAVDAAVYRICQESITNAVRHARQASRVSVCVDGDARSIAVSVIDDGVRSTFDRSTSSGYGLLGMAERVKLLGGSFSAGPSPDRADGWTIRAEIPRTGVACDGGVA